MKIYNLIASSALAVTVLFSACTDDFDELNVNPNGATPEKMAPAGVLASNMRKAFHEDRYEFWRGVVLHAERFSGQTAAGYNGNWWSPSDSYTYNEGWTSAAWESYNTKSNNGFGGALFANSKLVLDFLKSNPDYTNAKEFEGIAKTIQAFQFLKLTDLFGDIPYSQHSDVENYPSPEFDKQKDIYAGLELVLRDVVENLLNSDSSIVLMTNSDLLYGGDVKQWQKFANALRLRMAIRQSTVDATNASSILTEVVKFPLPESNADNAGISRTTSTTDLQNQYWGFFSTWKGFNGEISYSWDSYNMTWGPGPGAFLPAYDIIEYMKGSDLYEGEVNSAGNLTTNINPLSGIADPRINKFFMAPGGDALNAHKGMRPRELYVLDAGEIVSKGSHPVEGNALNYSWMHPSIWYDGGDWNPVSLDYAEVCLSLAEAVQRGLVTYKQNAASWLKDGLDASCERWGANNSGFSSDVVTRFNASTASDKLEILYVEKWISAYTVPHQSYASLRRTGSPRLSYLTKDLVLTGDYTEPDGSVTANKQLNKYAKGSTDYVLPARMRIPESEFSVNPNVPESSKDMSTKVWWAGGN
jgi:hypothetical protein